ncbi:MAG: Rrf2 family transcriptional regulator [Roseiarcus sp.]
MSRSSKLASAAQILAFVASEGPEQVTTEVIAEAIHDHPTRVRQIVAALSKANLLVSVRGANGGVTLARPPGEIDLKQVFQAIGEQALIGFEVREISGGWRAAGRINSFFHTLYARMDEKMVEELGRVSLEQIAKR